MVNHFNPMLGVVRGQQIQQGLSQAELEGYALRDIDAKRKAAAGYGQGNYFAGYEGQEGAERPEYLKNMFAEGNFEDAAKIEEHLAAPFANKRAIATAGAIEEQKREAQARVMKDMIKDFMDDPGRNPLHPDNGGGMPGMGGGGGEVPSSPAVGEPNAITRQPNFKGVPDTEMSVEMSPQGPKLVMKRKSPFEKAIAISEDSIKRANSGIASDAEKRMTHQNAHDNVRKTKEAIATTRKAIENRDIDPETGMDEIGRLQEELAAFSQQRDQLLRGGSAPTSPTVGAPPPMAPAAAPRPPIIGRFTNKERAGMDVKNREEKTTAANKEITNARLGTEKVLKFKKQVGELFDLVTKQDIGHPTMEGIPFAGNMLSFSRANAQVKKLNEAIINMFAEPGQSQMMNTIIERQMQGAVVPSIFTEPQQNKVNAAILRSNVEHLEKLPGFLEKWAKNHDDTLDGAADAWIDYTENNQGYNYSKDKRGRVTVKKSPSVMSPDKWLDLKASGGVRSIGGKAYIRQKDGSWTAK